MFSSHSCSILTSPWPPKPRCSAPQWRRSSSSRSCRPVGCWPATSSQSRHNRRSTDARPLLPYRSEKIRHAFVFESINGSCRSRCCNVLCLLSIVANAELWELMSYKIFSRWPLVWTAWKLGLLNEFSNFGFKIRIQHKNYQKYMIRFFFLKNITVKVMIRSANQF